jgi:hypothetical protein
MSAAISVFIRGASGHVMATVSTRYAAKTATGPSRFTPPIII